MSRVSISSSDVSGIGWYQLTPVLSPPAKAVSQCRCDWGGAPGASWSCGRMPASSHADRGRCVFDRQPGIAPALETANDITDVFEAEAKEFGSGQARRE